MAVSPERWWTVQQGQGPIIATAIHNGRELRAEVADAIERKVAIAEHYRGRFDNRHLAVL
jgi:hypothetical protein